MQKELYFNENIQEKFGIKTNIQEMDTGEIRSRIIGSDNSSYIRTESNNNEYWQNAHFHNSTNELYLVQKGKILIAIEKNKKIEFIELNKNDSYTVFAGTVHNVYMYKNTVTHTIKFGECLNNDWILNENFDKITKNVILEIKEK